MALAKLHFLRMHLGPVLADIAVVVVQNDTGPAATVVAFIVVEQAAPLAIRTRAMNGMMPRRSVLVGNLYNRIAVLILIALEGRIGHDIENLAFTATFSDCPINYDLAVIVVRLFTDKPF